jgi:hypothetical protein
MTMFAPSGTRTYDLCKTASIQYRCPLKTVWTSRSLEIDEASG